MPILSIKPKAVTKTKVQKNVITNNIEGTIVEVNNSYFVEVKNVLYKIHSTSLDTKDVRKVYTKDDLGHWLIYDRVIKEDRRRMKPYLPFKPTFECIGSIVKEDDGIEYFKIKKSWNPRNIDERDSALKEIEDGNACE